MDISVIIPTYDRAALLPTTLRAVLAQTVQPREIIVVNDGSTDNTTSVLSGFTPAVRTIAIRNAGSIVARNVGLREAAGKFVAFCDSDDLWWPRFLERMTALLHAEPRIQFAYGNFVIIRNDLWDDVSKFDAAPPGYWDGLRRLDHEIAVFDEPIVSRLIAFQPFFPSTLMANRMAFLAAGGWDEGVGRTVGDDFATALRLAELAPLGILQTPLVGIRKHPGNFSANVRAMNLGDADVLEHVLATRPTLTLHSELIRNSVARRRRDALDHAFVDFDFNAVRSIYRKLPPQARSFRLRLKRLVSSLPQPLATPLARLLRGRGSNPH